MTSAINVVSKPRNNSNNMRSNEANNMVALIKAINGNKAAVEAIGDDGVEPWWKQRLAEGTADQWIPVLEAFAKDGVVEIEQVGVDNIWVAYNSADFNHDLTSYRPVRKPLCVWAVVRDRTVASISFSEDVAKLAARPDDTVVKLTEEVGKRPVVYEDAKSPSPTYHAMKEVSE